MAQFTELLNALDLKEQAFVLEYLKGWNATEAARVVWTFSAAKQQGHKVLHRPDVAAAIAAAATEMRDAISDPERFRRELELIAYADPRELVDANGNLIPLAKLPEAVRRAVASVDLEVEKVTTEDVIDGAEGLVPKSKKRVTTRTRVVKYKLAPKVGALELLGKRVHSAKRATDRVRKISARHPRDISVAVRARVMERDDFKCRRCGWSAPEVKLVLDHIIPVARGGTCEEDNLHVLCWDCNAGKGARMPHAHDFRGPRLASVPAD
jgi:5-methylcytosine-specific restriction endonuclease McrA